MINRDAIKLIFILWMTLMVVASQAQNIGINASGSIPNYSAGLDVDFTNKGMLVPRVALTGTVDVATIATPAISLLVYNTATAGVAPNNVTPGYYYWSGTVWLKLATGGTSSNDWMITGNSGLDSTINYLGTSNTQPIIFRTNNLKRVKVTNDGFVGFKTMAPLMDFEVATETDASKNGVIFKGKDVYNTNISSSPHNLGFLNCSIYTVLTSTDKYKQIFLWRPNGALRIGAFDTTTVFNTLPGESIALGSNSTADLLGIAIGSDSWAGKYSLALGNNSKADSGAVAIGYSNANGYGSFALGGKIDGNYAYSLGNNIVNNNYSIAIGNRNYANYIGTYALGNYCNPKANNAFVIGTGPGGPCSNPTYLENTTGNSLAVGFNSNTATLFVGPSSGINTTGNVGIGTTSPTAKLEVAGQVKITGGTPGAGKVLTSDATGLATWQSTSNSAWGLTGNSATVVSTNFIGTTDAIDFVTRTNNIERSRITSAGNFGIGDATPSALFTVGNGDLFQVVSTGHMRNINGTAALPSHSFVNDDDNGMYLSTTNELSFSTAATQRSVITATGNFGIGDATPSALFTVGNGDLFQVVSTGHMRNINGTAALPSHSFVNDDDNGMYLSTTNELSFSTAATQRMVVSSTGNVGIANATPLNKLDVAGAGTASNGIAGFNEVVAHFKNTNATTHSAISVDALTSQDPVIYLAENGSPYWDIRNDSDGPDKFQIRWQGGSGSNTPRFTIDNAGNVGIGTTAPTQRLTVFNGTSTGTYTTTGWVHTSDARLKTNVVNLDNSLEKVLKLNGVSYNWKNNPDADKQIGFIAQEVERIVPEVVVMDSEGNYAMAYQNLNALLVEAMKEQQTQIEDLKSQKENLVKEVQEMKKMMQEIIESNKK
jgi:hypothetical protein